MLLSALCLLPCCSCIKQALHMECAHGSVRAQQTTVACLCRLFALECVGADGHADDSMATDDDRAAAAAGEKALAAAASGR